MLTGTLSRALAIGPVRAARVCRTKGLGYCLASQGGRRGAWAQAGELL